MLLVFRGGACLIYTSSVDALEGSVGIDPPGASDLETGAMDDSLRLPPTSVRLLSPDAIETYAVGYLYRSRAVRQPTGRC